MKLLLDTHLLLWAAARPDKLSPEAIRLMSDEGNLLHYSVASLWEVAIKSAMGRQDLHVDTRRFRRMLQAHGYQEVAIVGEHATSVEALPPLHKDPFDRMLIAQARSDALLLITSDALLAGYGEGIHVV